jgi:hypothetical protein
MGRISNYREDPGTKLDIMEIHAFAMETLLREGLGEALSRLQFLKDHLRDRLQAFVKVLQTGDLLPAEIALGLEQRFEAALGIMEEDKAPDPSILKDQGRRIIKAFRAIGTYYDGNVESSVQGLDEAESEVFKVALAMEAEWEALEQVISWQETGGRERTGQDREHLADRISDFRARIQLARNDTVPVDDDLISGLSAELAEIRESFKE